MALMERKGCNMTIVFSGGATMFFFNEYFGIEIGNTIQIYQKKKNRKEKQKLIRKRDQRRAVRIKKSQMTFYK